MGRRVARRLRHAHAFHIAGFMASARALYERLGDRRAPELDRDVNAHYGVRATREWRALAYRKPVAVPPAA